MSFSFYYIKYNRYVKLSFRLCKSFIFQMKIGTRNIYEIYLVYLHFIVDEFHFVILISFLRDGAKQNLIFRVNYGNLMYRIFFSVSIL